MSKVQPLNPKVKTGRRANPAIDGPRDNTVCFMLSKGEKFNLDLLAFCLNVTRSGLLAHLTAEFLAASTDDKAGKEAHKRLLNYLSECRKAVTARGKMATETIQEMEKS